MLTHFPFVLTKIKTFLTCPFPMSSWRVFKNLVSQCNVNKYLVALGIGSMAMVGSVTGLLASMLQPMLDNIFIGKNQTQLWTLSIFLLILFTVKAAAEYVGNLSMTFVGQKLVETLQRQLFGHCLFLEYNFFQKNHDGHIVALLVQDTARIGEIFTDGITSLVINTITALSLLAVLIIKAPAFASFMFLFLPVFSLGALILGRKTRWWATQSAQTSGTIQSFFQQIFQNISLVKSYNYETQERARLETQLSALWEQKWAVCKLRILIHPIIELLCGLTVLMVVLMGGYDVIHGKMTTGTFLSFLTALLMLYNPIKNILRNHMRFQEGLAAACRIQTMLTQPISPEYTHPSETLHESLPGKNQLANLMTMARTQDIVFHNVSFAYPQGPSLFHNLSCRFKAGELSALVGLSGSGKSTILSLLLGFYRPAQGEILIGNTPLNQLDIQLWRQCIAFVGQQEDLFCDTVLANIAYGMNRNQESRPQAGSDDSTHIDSNENPITHRIYTSAKLANAHDFIEKMPQKYNAMMGSRGNQLSGGQRQRIALARSFFKNAPIILWDEATSALDFLSETKILKNSQTHHEHHTRIVVSHRLSSIQHAHRIFVFHQGKLVQRGNHEALLADINGIYHKMIQGKFL